MTGFYRAPTWGTRRGAAGEVKTFGSTAATLARSVDEIAAVHCETRELRATESQPESSAPVDAAAYQELEARYLRERHAREALEITNAAKDRLLAEVSHDLRTPLNSMLGWAQLMRRMANNVAVRERALEAIERSGRAQAELIDRLLDFSRIAAGKLSVALESVDLVKVVETVAEAIEPVALARGVQLRVALPSEAVTVMADRLRLEQIASNLVMNAVKFSARSGEIVIHLELATDGFAVLEVRDNGLGIAPELLPTLFDRFSQGSQADASEGLGLGLFIVRELVELHGGSIEVESAGINCGSTFVVRIPGTGASPTPAPESSVSLASGSGSGALDGLRVLLVEDDIESAELVATALRDQGASVEEAHGLAPALEAFDGVRPSVLVVEVGSVPARACAFLHSVRARIGGDLPAIALSAHAGADDVAVFLAAGFDVHLAKPISFDDLIEAVAAASDLTTPVEPGES